VGAIKYKTPKPVAHAQLALQVLALVFNYAHLLKYLTKELRRTAPQFFS
jgi:hypothetical protein